MARLFVVYEKMSVINSISLIFFVLGANIVEEIRRVWYNAYVTKTIQLPTCAHNEHKWACLYGGAYMDFRTAMIVVLLLFVSVMMCAQNMLDVCMTAAVSGELLTAFGFFVLHAVLLFICCKLLICIIEEYHNPMMDFVLGLYIKIYAGFAVLFILLGDTEHLQDVLCKIAVVLALRGITKI